MYGNAKSDLKVSSEYRDLLNEVVVEFTMASSTDFLDFACDFLGKKILDRNARNFEGGESRVSIDEGCRRRAVIACLEEEIGELKIPSFPKTDAQKEKLKKMCKPIVFFTSTTDAEMEVLISAMQMKTVSKGDYVIVEGAEGDFFYCVEKGHFVAVKEGVILKEYIDEGSFGELALMYDQPRACSVRAETDGLLWALDRKTFKAILMKQAIEKRALYESLIAKVPMLSALSPYERSNLCDAFESESYSAGDLIVREGDPAEKMFFIESGSVTVKSIDRTTGEERLLNRLEEGDYFGELALINRAPRAASVHAEGSVQVVSLTVDAFERLLGPCMDIMKRNIQDYKTT